MEALAAALRDDQAQADARLGEGLRLHPGDRLLRKLELMFAARRSSLRLAGLLERFSTDLERDPLALTTAARWWRHARHLPEAERAVRRALQLDPRCSAALAEDGLIALSRGAYREARRLVLAARAEAPGPEADWLFTQGAAEARLGLLRQAEATLRQALRVDPLHAEALGQLLLLLERMGRLDAARSTFTSHEQLRRGLRTPVPASVDAAMANALLLAGDLSGARPLLERAVVAEAHPDYLALLAEVCRQQGEPDRAREMLQRAMEAEPKNALAAQVRARMEREEAGKGR
jgi:tetratricopeptide (TPR) repeat protein